MIVLLPNTLESSEPTRMVAFVIGRFPAVMITVETCRQRGVRRGEAKQRSANMKMRKR